MISSSACPSSECSSSTETADPLCSTSKCCQSLAVFSAHLGSVCVGNESMCVFPFVRQMEGHRHHSAQQVGHHRGDNQQRRHYHFSHGECFVWSLHTHMGTLTHVWEEKHSDISVIIMVRIPNINISALLSAGGHGNGQVHRTPFHRQAQVLQTEQDLCRVSLEAKA